MSTHQNPRKKPHKKELFHPTPSSPSSRRQEPFAGHQSGGAHDQHVGRQRCQQPSQQPKEAGPDDAAAQAAQRVAWGAWGPGLMGGSRG